MVKTSFQKRGDPGKLVAPEGLPRLQCLISGEVDCPRNWKGKVKCWYFELRNKKEPEI